MPINLLADDSPPLINLLEEEPSSQSFEDLSPEDQTKVMEITKQQISSQHPNMPEWMRDLMLQLSPKNKSPMLDSAARGISDVTNYIPAAAGGALQGASIPIRGVASMIPTEFTQKLANSPDLRDLFPQPEGTGQQSVQTAAELLGGGGLFGKLLQGTKGAAALAKVPKMLQTPAALASAGYLATPGDHLDKSLGAGGALALGGAGKAVSKSVEKLTPFLRGLFSESNSEKLLDSIQKPHDMLYKQANDLYDYVRDTINKRGIKTPIKTEYLDEILEYPSMNSKTHRELVKKAKEGEYEAIHTLQRSLYQKGTKDLGNNDSVIETRGENLLDLRHNINEDLQNKLMISGNIDVAHGLKQAKNIYSTLQKTYYDKLLPKGIGKLVHPRIRLIPENTKNLFKQNSVAMKKFLEKHPDAVKHIQGIREKELAQKVLRGAALGVAGTSGTIYTVSKIADLFK